MKINVSQEDIKRGRHDNPHYCPVGLAIIEASEGRFPTIDGQRLSFDGRFRAYLPSNVQKFIEAFDARLPVEPVAFELRV